MGPLPGSAGSWCCTPGSPFFPLGQSGLQDLGAEAVDAVADRERGGPEEGAVLPAGHQAGQSEGVLLEGGFQTLEEGLALGFLFRGQVQRGHAAASRRGGISGCPSDSCYSREFPTYFRDAHPRAGVRRYLLAATGGA